MAHHLNTNKQFMVGNGILAFAVIFVTLVCVWIKRKMKTGISLKHIPLH